MKRIIIYALLLFAFGAEARYSETVDERADGREACQSLLYATGGRSQAIERVREILFEDFANGLYGDSTLSVSALNVTSVDATIVEMLARELEKPLVDTAREYSNAAMLLANAYGTPGTLSPAIRVQSARGQILSAPWLSAAKQKDLEQRLNALAARR